MTCKAEQSFATELLKDQKGDKKKLIAVIVVQAVLNFLIVIGMLGGFLWYLNSYEYQSNSKTTEIQATQDGEGVNIVNGGDLYGAESHD